MDWIFRTDMMTKHDLKSTILYFKNTLNLLCILGPRYLKHPVTIQVQGFERC